MIEKQKTFKERNRYKQNTPKLLFKEKWIKYEQNKHKEYELEL